MPDIDSNRTTNQASNDAEKDAVSYLGTIARFASPPPTATNATLRKLYKLSIGRKLMPHERIHDCLRKIIPGKRSVDVIYEPDKKRAHYKNLMTCGSVHICAVCAARISERRAEELKQGITRWCESGGFVAMLTFTLRHNADDSLRTLYDAMAKSHRDFKAGKGFQNIKDRYSWHGSITATEVTHGLSGWHPHMHELVLFEPVSPEAWRNFKAAAKARWLSSLDRSGRDASWEHGLDIREGDQDVYDYIAKFGHEPDDSRWTLDREIAKAVVKESSRDGRTPFQMLMDYGAGDSAAGTLFQEYATVFKGKKQLVWSRGLRDELAMQPEQTDEEIAEELPENYVTLVSLNPYQWRQILALPDEIHGYLLAIAQNGNKNDLQAFLARFGIFVNCDSGDGHTYQYSPAGV